MLADPLTKGLAQGLYSTHVKNMSLSSSFVDSDIKLGTILAT